MVIGVMEERDVVVIVVIVVFYVVWCDYSRKGFMCGMGGWYGLGMK